MKDDPFAEVISHFSSVEAVTVNAGRGSQGLKLGRKMFVMFYKGELLAQIAPDRVAELIAAGQGKSFDPGTGKPMKDRVLVPVSLKNIWIGLCEESLRYAQSRL
jgi:hypothetical protein